MVDVKLPVAGVNGLLLNPIAEVEQAELVGGSRQKLQSSLEIVRWYLFVDSPV